MRIGGYPKVMGFVFLVILNVVKNFIVNNLQNHGSCNEEGVVTFRQPFLFAISFVFQPVLEGFFPIDLLTK